MTPWLSSVVRTATEHMDCCNRQPAYCAPPDIVRSDSGNLLSEVTAVGGCLEGDVANNLSDRMAAGRTGRRGRGRLCGRPPGSR